MGRSLLKTMRIVRPTSLIYTVLTALILGGGLTVIGLRATPVGGWLGLIPLLLVIGLGLRRSFRRWQVARTSVPRRWQRWLRDHVPFYRALGDEGRARFERDVQFFIDEHNFEGIDGVKVVDELRLGVAAGAALLLHGRPDWELGGAASILFYPDAFDEQYYGGEYADYDGMAHEQGPMLLSARAVRESWADPGDGNNVVLHELAHLFDFKNEGADGVPSLMNPSSEQAWKQLVRREMTRVRRGRSLLRPYAATAPSEFFAVAVEVFFEQPRAMEREHSELFDALRAFFDLDPRGEGEEEDVEAWR